MSGHTPFAALNSRNNYYMKALYFAFGHNHLVDMLPGVPHQMRVDAIEFAKLYSEQFKDAAHVIAIEDCFKMYLAGKQVFTRE